MRQRKVTSPARIWWYMHYRQLRIIRREVWKQTIDVMCFGTGYVVVGENIPDHIQHVPLDTVFV